jgi:hypothetical protein
LGNTISSAGYDRQHAQDERSARRSRPQHAGETLGDILAAPLSSRNDGRRAAASGNAGNTWGNCFGDVK